MSSDEAGASKLCFSRRTETVYAVSSQGSQFLFCFNKHLLFISLLKSAHYGGTLGNTFFKHSEYAHLQLVVTNKVGII